MVINYCFGRAKFAAIHDGQRTIMRTVQASAFWLLVICPFTLATGAPLALKEKLAAIAQTHGFAISGLEHVGDETIEADPVASAKQLPDILHRYNFAIITQPTGKIERLVISGRKQEGKAPELFNHIKTTRVGSHHQVEARLLGPDGKALLTPLVVDTGATTIVLPLSLASDLGFKADQLNPGITKTANGDAPVYSGMLRSVTLGTITRKDVAVNFVDDERLGKTRLLGMSFLGQFKLTIDDARQELILLSK
jgi:aspartyl protease family protein